MGLDAGGGGGVAFDPGHGWEPPESSAARAQGDRAMRGTRHSLGLVRASLGLGAAALVLSCADVTVRKDDGQSNLDGFRYYLPRPFIVVKKEMPVGGGEVVLTGKQDQNLATIVIPYGALPKDLAPFFALGEKEDLYIPLSTLQWHSVPGGT